MSNAEHRAGLRAFKSRLAGAIRRVRLQRLFGKPPEEIFAWIFESNYWGNPESRSGGGSDDIQTRNIARALPELCKCLEVKSILDIPCGDFHWMKRVNLEGVSYIGADIVSSLVERNRQLYPGPDRRFMRLDLVHDPLPKVDLVFVRDCLVHLSYDLSLKALRNIRESGSTWLATTTFSRSTPNRDIRTGDWRPLNLSLPPFGLPTPAQLIIEGSTEFAGGFADKAIGVWRTCDLRI